MWHSLVVRLVRDQEAAGSNPVTPTRKRQVSTETCRFQLYSPYGELYAPSVRDICFASDMPAGVGANITNYYRASGHGLWLDSVVLYDKYLNMY